MLIAEICNMDTKIRCRVTIKKCSEFKKDTEMPVTEQVPYGKLTTEALG